MHTGSVAPGDYDSLLAKLIVHGADRAQALRRARVALDEMIISGLPTVLPFHLAVVRDHDFTDAGRFGVHTTWIESEFAATLAAPGTVRAADAVGGAAGHGAELAAPMNGSLVKWVADDGATVAAGDPIAILEAMKMETTISAHRSGTVARGPQASGDEILCGEAVCRID